MSLGEAGTRLFLQDPWRVVSGMHEDCSRRGSSWSQGPAGGQLGGGWAVWPLQVQCRGSSSLCRSRQGTSTFEGESEAATVFF